MPRDVMLPMPARPGGKNGRFYKQVRNVTEYVNLLLQHAPHEDVWVGPRPVTMYHQPQQHRAYFDIDGELQDALERARRLRDLIEERWGVDPQAIFTAGKGFHLHVEHPPLQSSGGAYRDAVISATEPAKADPDQQPLVNSRAMPRLPYSLNTGSVAKHGEVLYCVPVDLTWDLPRILEASRAVEVRPIRIPVSEAMAEELAPKCLRIDAEKRVLRDRPVPQKNRDELVRTAIAFVENAAWQLRETRGPGRGRWRVLHHLYIPALVHELGADKQAILARCRGYVERSEGRWDEWQAVVERDIDKCYLGGGDVLFPMNLKKFFAINKDLRLS